MDRSSLTFKTFKNATYNILGFFWPLIFTLLITPLIIFGLGVKEYGVYLFINTTIGLFGLFDLGLGTAVAKHLSYYYGKKDSAAIKRISHSANSLFLITAILGTLITIIISLWGADILPDKFSNYEKYSVLFLIGGLIFFSNTITSTYNSIIVAVQRFDITNKIGMISVTLSSLSMLVIVKTGGSLTLIFLAQLTVSSIVALIIFHSAKKLLPEASFQFGWDKAEIKNCYTFGLVNFINTIGSSALTSLDRLIIPLFVGPSNLTYYSMPGNVTTKIPGMSNTLSVSLFPTVSQLSGSEDIERIKTLYIRSFRLITVVAGALTISCISFADQILRYWLNAQFAEKSTLVLIILALTNFILALYNPLSNFLLGLGKLKFLSISSIGMALLNIVLLFMLLPKHGIVGAALAYLFSVIPVTYLFYYVEKNYLKLSGRKRYYSKTIFGNILVGAIIFCLNFILADLVTSLVGLLVIGGATSIFYIVLYKLLGFFETEDWVDMERFFSLIYKKIIPTKI